MITNEVGFLIATGAIYKTTDGGETFSETLISDFSPQDIQFPVPDTGYITAYNGFYRTIDGGDSWQNMSSLGTSERYDVFFIDRDTGYYCTQYGTSLAKTVDAANSFTSVNVDTQGLTSYLNCIYFLNSQNGFVGGRHGFFGRTSDGGQTWTLIPTGMTSVFDGIYTIYFVNDLIGFCGGSNGTLMKTTDGGLTWNYLISGQTQGISEIIFLNENEGYFTTGLGNGYTPGSIYHTYDGGLSWQLFYALNYYGIKGFDVPENFNLFVIGRGSQFWELLPSLESPEPLEPIVVCDNASFSVVVPEGYTPQWTLPGSLAIFSTDVEIPANAISGQDTLFLNYINQQNCRSAKIAVDITIIDSPEAPILAASATQVCIGDSVSITSNLNEILTWNTEEVTDTLVVYQSGEYTASYNDGTCTSDSSEAIEINVIDLSTPIIETEEISFCPGDSLLLSAVGEGEFLWSDGSVGSDNYVNEPGSYTVTSVVENCESPISNTLEIALYPVPGIPVITQLNNEQLFASGDEYSYIWFWGGNPTGGNNDTLQTNLVTGNYSVAALNEFGCASETSQNYFYSAIGISEIERMVSVYPNPAQNGFTISGMEAILSWKIYDGLGRTIEQSGSVQSSRLYISCTAWAPGVYWIELTTSSGLQKLPVQVR
jgi:photosystem II stability/assembly factor-like uncharacterized protein